jgi:hypothetical protein
LPEVRERQAALFGGLTLFPLDAERWTKTAAAQRQMALAVLGVIQDKPPIS